MPLPSPVALFEGGVGREGTGEQAEAEGTVGHVANAIGEAPGEDSGFHATVIHVVADLVGGDVTVLLALFHHVDVEVGDAVVADLAALLELLEAFHRLLDRGVVVGPVNQHQVDEISVESAQAALRVLDDVGLLRVAADHLGRVVVIEADLGDEHDLVAAIAQRFGEQFLGVVGAVDLSGVEEGDAAVDGHVDGAGGLIDIDVAVHRGAHLPGAETDG